VGRMDNGWRNIRNIKIGGHHLLPVQPPDSPNAATKQSLVSENWSDEMLPGGCKN